MKSDPEIGFWRTDYHTVNGFSHFYRDWPPREESSLPVLALHGSLTQSGMWVAPAEAAGTVHMLCPDQRGFGRSEDPGSDSCAEFASDALALAQYLLPERYVIMAHSFACSIALAAAHGAASNVAAVVLVDPVVHVGMSAAPAAPSPPPPEKFDTLEDAGRHFRNTEEGEWTDEALRRFVQDIMMREGESGPWRFPYTPRAAETSAGLHRLARKRLRPIRQGKGPALPDTHFSRRHEQAFSASSRAAFPSGVRIKTQTCGVSHKRTLPELDRTRHRNRGVEALPQ